MGMFDYVRCREKMPDGLVLGDGEDFQTKDFGCTLDLFEIKDGRLEFKKICEATDGEWQLNPSNFHGWLNFYTGRGNPNGVDYSWHEYMAKFTDGKLVKILTLEQYRGEHGCQ